ncbi:MAG: hypothetical protein JXR36_04275 [Bacteroidales bacterium]|nr:hypothetical protein [Bacteroidales bacterium]
MKKEERKNRFIEKLDKSMNATNVISGVHNYCDRWCERCKFIRRCRVGLIELERSDNYDVNGSEFWEELSAIFEATYDMVVKKAEEMGIDLSDAPNVEFEKREPSEIETEAEDYGISVYNWMKENYEGFQNLALEFAEKEFAIPDFKEAVDVINWYELFIPVKIRRAADGLFKDDIFDDDLEFKKNDSDGSAKIAIIAISRSIEAFTVLYHQFPKHEDAILDFLKRLSIIKQKMLITFPDAMSFKRPGFDD